MSETYHLLGIVFGFTVAAVFYEWLTVCLPRRRARRTGATRSATSDRDGKRPSPIEQNSTHTVGS